jgi:hypothetical protein
MGRLQPLLMFAWLAACPIAFAGDLSKVDRTLAREPAYRSKPRYCLLAFGPEAMTRVWFVQDGDTLYVDRNGNGDLTEPGKKVFAEKRDGADDGRYTFKIGEIHDGKRVHKELELDVRRIDRLAKSDESVRALLAKNPRARGYNLRAEVEMPGWKGATLGGRVQHYTWYTDGNGVFQFADRPQDAPILHFGGPWQITLFGAHRLRIGREDDVVLGVGTPGVGPGTMTYIDYEGVIPENVYPTVEITYPPPKPTGPRLTERYQLKRRC